MVCQILLYNKVNQLYVYIHPHILSLLRLPPTLPIPPLQVVTQHRADLPVLCGCFPLTIYITFGSVYMSMSLSHFIPNSAAGLNFQQVPTQAKQQNRPYKCTEGRETIGQQALILFFPFSPLVSQGHCSSNALTQFVAPFLKLWSRWLFCLFLCMYTSCV